MNQKTSKVEKEFYLRCSYLTLSVLFDKEPKNIATLYKKVAILIIIPAAGVEPARPQRTLDFESSASANSATPANLKIITGVAGFEPTHEGVKVPCLTAWLYPKNKGRMMGIEPTNAGATIRCVNHFATFAIIKDVI